MTATCGAKTEMALQAFERMPGNFTMRELLCACPAIMLASERSKGCSRALKLKEK